MAATIIFSASGRLLEFSFYCWRQIVVVASKEMAFAVAVLFPMLAVVFYSALGKSGHNNKL